MTEQDWQRVSSFVVGFLCGVPWMLIWGMS